MPNFPYRKYLKETSFVDLHQLEIDRAFLQKKRGIGDEFLYYLSEKFIILYPPRFRSIEKTIKIGEQFLSYKSKKGLRNGELYRIIGYFILGKCGREIEKYALKKYENQKNKIERLKSRLETNNTYITTITASDFDKLVDNLKKGNVFYIVDRLRKKAKSFPQTQTGIGGRKRCRGLFRINSN